MTRAPSCIRNNSIDLVKVIATVMVIALHLRVCWDWTVGDNNEFIYYLCGIAIPLFFMVSGYLMAGKQVQWSYSVSKCFNVIKVPFVICLLYDAFLLVRHGIFLFSFPLCLIQRGDWWHFWYFGSMAVIYLFLPLLLRIIQGKRLDIAMCSLLVVCFTFWLLDVFTGFEKRCLPQTFRMWYFVLYFLIGAKIRVSNKVLKVSGLVTLLLAFIYILSGLIIKAGGVEYNFGSPFCVFYAVSFFLFIQSVRLEKIADSFFWKKARNAVLPTYMFHVLLLNKLTMAYVHPLMEKMHVYSAVAFLVELVFTTVASYVFSMILTSIPLFNKVFKL